MDRPIAFSPQDARELVRIVRKSRDQTHGIAPLRTDHRGPTVHVYVAKTPSGGIAAMSGTTPGSATCDLYKFNASNQLAVTSPLKQKTVYNIATAMKVSGSSYIIIRREVLSGKFIVDGYLAYKPLVRFTLNAALTTSEASETATISAQYGPGIDSPDTGSGAITVHNLLTATASVYVFSGASGAAGLAMWDSGANYRIIQMECP